MHTVLDQSVFADAHQLVDISRSIVLFAQLQYRRHCNNLIILYFLYNLNTR